jgi:YD repeat-containing protein
LLRQLLLRPPSADGDVLSTIAYPDTGTATFLYDGAGKLSAVQAPGNRTTTVTVNGSGDLTVLQNPDARLHTFTYDAAHRLTRDEQGSPLEPSPYEPPSGSGALGARLSPPSGAVRKRRPQLATGSAARFCG